MNKLTLPIKRSRSYVEATPRQAAVIPSMAAALILLSSLVLMPIGSASAATVYYSFIGVVDEAKKDASDYGFSVGDIIRGTASIDDAQVPYSS